MKTERIHLQEDFPDLVSAGEFLDLRKWRRKFKRVKREYFQDLSETVTTGGLKRLGFWRVSRIRRGFRFGTAYRERLEPQSLG